MQEAIFYEDKKKNADLFIRKYRYSDGRDILAFSYTEQNIGKLQIKYLWNDAEKKYELCDWRLAPQLEIPLPIGAKQSILISGFLEVSFV